MNEKIDKFLLKGDKFMPGNVLHDRAFNIANIQNMEDIDKDLLQWFKNFLIRSFLLSVYGQRP